MSEPVDDGATKADAAAKPEGKAGVGDRAGDQAGRDTADNAADDDEGGKGENDDDGSREDPGDEDPGDAEAGDDEAGVDQTGDGEPGDDEADDDPAKDNAADDPAQDDAAKEDAADADGDAIGSKPDDDDAPKKASRLWWLLPAAVILEFWIYGHNGTIEVCVGKEGQTDFSLIGSERTDDNRWSFPRCETRLNLGLQSEFDAQAADAKKIACRGATLFKNRGEASQCEASEDGWTERVDGQFCPPWDPNYYEHLFWFLK